MLAGLAPLHAERLSSRGGPSLQPPDPLVFYDTSSYGPSAVRMLEELVGSQQLLYGSDRPVVEPGELGMPRGARLGSDRRRHPPCARRRRDGARA